MIPARDVIALARLTRSNLVSSHCQASNGSIISAVIRENDIIFDKIKVDGRVRGILWQNPHNRWRMALNTGHNPRYPFLSAAHLLGHYLLHRKKQHIFVCCGYKSLDTEREADLFALHLLLPKELLINLTKQYPSIQLIASLPEFRRAWSRPDWRNCTS